MEETRHLTVVAQESKPCAPRATCTVANLTSTAGTATQIQLGLIGGDPTVINDSLLNITVDGTLVLSAPIGIVFGTYGNGPPSCGDTTRGSPSQCAKPQYFTSKYQSLTYIDNFNMDAVVGYKIPFTSSLLVTYTNESTSAGTTLWSHVYYYPGAAPVGLLTSRQVHFNSVYHARHPVAQYAIDNLINVLGRGILNSLALDVSAPVSQDALPTWLEGNLAFTTDAVARITCIGTEDCFGSSFYFGYGMSNAGTKGIFTTLGSSTIGTTFIGRYNDHATPYLATNMVRYFDLDTVVFNSSLAIDWPNGQSGEGAFGPGTVNVASLVTYYTF
jgi:hypothetical protein